MISAEEINTVKQEIDEVENPLLSGNKTDVSMIDNMSVASTLNVSINDSMDDVENIVTEMNEEKEKLNKSLDDLRKKNNDKIKKEISDQKEILNEKYEKQVAILESEYQNRLIELVNEANQKIEKIQSGILRRERFYAARSKIAGFIEKKAKINLKKTRDDLEKEKEENKNLKDRIKKLNDKFIKKVEENVNDQETKLEEELDRVKKLLVKKENELSKLNAIITEDSTKINVENRKRKRLKREIDQVKIELQEAEETNKNLKRAREESDKIIDEQAQKYQRIIDESKQNEVLMRLQKASADALNAKLQRDQTQRRQEYIASYSRLRSELQSEKVKRKALEIEINLLKRREEETKNVIEKYKKQLRNTYNTNLETKNIKNDQIIQNDQMFKETENKLTKELEQQKNDDINKLILEEEKNEKEVQKFAEQLIDIRKQQRKAYEAYKLSLVQNDETETSNQFEQNTKELRTKENKAIIGLQRKTSEGQNISQSIAKKISSDANIISFAEALINYRTKQKTKYDEQKEKRIKEAKEKAEADREAFLKKRKSYNLRTRKDISYKESGNNKRDRKSENTIVNQNSNPGGGKKKTNNTKKITNTDGTGGVGNIRTKFLVVEDDGIKILGNLQAFQ